MKNCRQFKLIWSNWFNFVKKDFVIYTRSHFEAWNVYFKVNVNLFFLFLLEIFFYSSCVVIITFTRRLLHQMYNMLHYNCQQIIKIIKRRSCWLNLSRQSLLGRNSRVQRINIFADSLASYLLGPTWCVPRDVVFGHVDKMAAKSTPFERDFTESRRRQRNRVNDLSNCKIVDAVGVKMNWRNRADES